MYYSSCRRVIRVGCKYLKWTVYKIWQVLIEPLKHSWIKKEGYCSIQWECLKLFRPWKLSSMCCSGNTAVLPPLALQPSLSPPIPAKLSLTSTPHPAVPAACLFTCPISLYGVPRDRPSLNPRKIKDRISLRLTKISPSPLFFAADSPLFSSTDFFTKTLRLETTCLNMENLLWLVGILP